MAVNEEEPIGSRDLIMVENGLTKPDSHRWRLVSTYAVGILKLTFVKLDKEFDRASVGLGGTAPLLVLDHFNVAATNLGPCRSCVWYYLASTIAPKQPPTPQRANGHGSSTLRLQVRLQ